MSEYDFSGRVFVEGGCVVSLERIVFVYDEWGPFVRSRRYEPLEGDSFVSRVHNWFDGVRLRGVGFADTRVCLVTAMGELRFTLGELAQKRHISKPVGGHYAMAILHAEGPECWFLEEFPPGERVFGRGDFVGGVERDWFAVKGALMAPGGALRLRFAGGSLAGGPGGSGGAERRTRFRLRFLVNASSEGEAWTRGTPRFTLALNGKRLWSNDRFTSYHDVTAQWLEEVFFTSEDPLRSGENEIVLSNLDDSLSVLVPLLGVLTEVVPALEVRGCPRWALVGKPFALRLALRETGRIAIDYDPDLLDFAPTRGTRRTLSYKSRVAGLNPVGTFESAVRVLPPGESDFYFIPRSRPAGSEPGGITVRFVDEWTGVTAVACVPSLYDVPPEAGHCFTGVELRTGTPGDYLPFLRRLRDEQYGDLVVFRNYHNDAGDPARLWEAAAFCRQNGLMTDAIIMDDGAVVAEASAGNCLCVGTHEHTGIFYGRDDVLDAGFTLREAAACCVAKLREVAQEVRVPGVPVAVGDATGGTRYAYMAGFDVIRHETFVAHHGLILPNARGAARAFSPAGGPTRAWGAHIASQHNAQPELEYGIRRLFLGVYLPWIMGARFLFEEDSQFQYFKAEKMCAGDYLPARKTALLRDFYEYSSTHPRRGEPLVPTAVLQGRYAPPVSGLGFDRPQDNYPVWSYGGNRRWAWGYRQPEKGLHLLDVLAPGICLTPLHQDSERVRRFFSGSPCGEYDFLPVEAESGSFARYRLLLLLDWHTMDADGWEKLRRFAEAGGALFLSVPHLTTRVDRDFLEEMRDGRAADLRLYNGGEVEALCGVRVRGPSAVLFTQPEGRGAWAAYRLSEPSGLRRPNRSADEDGPCFLADVELAGAEPLVTVPSGGGASLPLLTRFPLGKGCVYLLCAWAWPGHEALAAFMPAVVRRLLALHARGPLSLAGEAAADLYYSLWSADGGSEAPDKCYVLNTDWVTAANRKTACLSTPACSAQFPVTEGALSELSVFSAGLLRAEAGRKDVSITRRTPQEEAWETFALRPFRLEVHSESEPRLSLNGEPLKARREGEVFSCALPGGRNLLRYSA